MIVQTRSRNIIPATGSCTKHNQVVTIRNERNSNSAKEGPHCYGCVAWRAASCTTEPASSEAPWRDQVQSSCQGDVPRAANEAWQDTPPSHNLMYGTLVLEGTETDEQVLYSSSVQAHIQNRVAD